ncbi:hypothetical protein E2I00_002416 [Balaenoptera physalus]|uniref:Synaptopodin n=1 Tax=Balaenoptera physalus TaxID=9770 RepID=A0A643C677_BALPH|nr:hypothetical protein E2I00_002416 [Balaenoptera physalus]
MGRSTSLTEKDLKEAKARSQQIAAQLTTPPSSNSRGVQLFNRRRQREASLLRHLEKVASEEEEVPLVVYLKENAALLTANGLHLSQNREAQQSPPTPPPAEAQLPPKGAVPDFKPSTPCAGGQPQEPAAEVRSSTLLIDKVSAPPTTTSTFSREVTPISSSRPPAPDFMSSSLLIDVQLGAPVVSTEQEMSGRAAATTPIKLYSEVHLTLAKPPSVVNRTARPFGIQAPGGTSQMERSPMVERRHLGEKGPASRPPSVADRSPRPQRHVMSHSPMLERRPGQAVPASKTGILEESIARRGSRKSMFTFVEKPKVTPNPDLLDLVQTADEKRRQRDQGEMGVEEEPFALGAEASNFQQEPAPRDRASPAGAEEIVPEWASCLKSPRIQAKPKPKPNQNLSEASGKGAELYARRQSRMEKYVIESSGHAERARCPSPTMSLPSLPKAALPPSPALPRPSRSSPGLYTSPGQDGLRPTAVSPTYSSDVSPGVVSPSQASPQALLLHPECRDRGSGVEAFLLLQVMDPTGIPLPSLAKKSVEHGGKPMPLMVQSPGILGYNICPRGWNGSLRLKRGSLPTEASCTT